MRTINPENNKIINLYTNACGFEETCFSEIRKYYFPTPEERILQQTNQMPSIKINGLFAIELFCKYILVIDQLLVGNPMSYKGIHYFKDLYDDFEPKTKKEIRKKLKELECKESNFYNFKSKTQSGKSYDPIKLRYSEFKKKNIYKFDIITMVKIIKALHIVAYRRFCEIAEGAGQNLLRDEVTGVKGKHEESSPLLDEISERIIKKEYDIVGEDE